VRFSQQLPPERRLEPRRVSVWVGGVSYLSLIVLVSESGVSGFCGFAEWRSRAARPLAALLKRFF
jgi:hypothetical protein